MRSSASIRPVACTWRPPAGTAAIPIALRSAPQKGRRNVGTDHFCAYRTPELAHLGFDLDGFASQDLVDEAGLSRQSARADRQTARKVHSGLHALMDAIRVVFRRTQNHIPENVE